MYYTQYKNREPLPVVGILTKVDPSFSSLLSQVLHTMSNTSIARASVGRSIPSAPLRILDAPDLVDDYYLNLISWGHNNVSYTLHLFPLGATLHCLPCRSSGGHASVKYLARKKMLLCEKGAFFLLLCSLVASPINLDA